MDEISGSVAISINDIQRLARRELFEVERAVVIVGAPWQRREVANVRVGIVAWPMDSRRLPAARAPETWAPARVLSWPPWQCAPGRRGEKCAE